MQKNAFPIITVSWIAITVFVAAMSLYNDYNRLQKALSSDVHFIYSSVYEKTYINEILLQNFTALVSARPDDLEAIRSFASEMRKRYPHIERLQIQQQQNLQGLDENIRFPTTFLEPLTPDTRYLLQQDLMADPLFAETIDFARRYHQPVASPPFALDKDNTGYSLFLAFFSRNTPPDSSNLNIASLAINISSLLPSSSFLSDNASITLLDADGRVLDQRFTSTNISDPPAWLPILKEQRTINRFGQPFQLEVATRFGPRHINISQLLILLLCSILVYLLLIAYLRQRSRVAQQQLSIYEKLDQERQQLEARIHIRTRELQDQLIENQRLTHQVIAVQEKERRNLSRELHDELGQSLTAIRTDAKILKRIHPEDNSIVNQTAESIDAIAQNIYDVTYGMMRTLRPSALDDLGLVDAIQECIVSNRFDQHGITLHTDFRGALNEMSEDYNITLFRLTQEAFSNIIKYARARNVWIDIHRTEQGQRKEISNDRVELVISDDGTGFDIEKNAFKAGFGLIGMRERVRALGGVFQISKNHDQGTRIMAVIPITPSVSEAVESAAIPDPAAPVEPAH